MEEQIKKKKNSKRRRRMKRKLASMTAMVLVLMVGIMGTMAYLSTVSNSKHNTFTGSKGISLGLTEPGWDADGDDTKTPAPGEGRYDAENYTPGKTIAKDPTLTNTTTAAGDANAQEWVAIAVSYTIGDDKSPITYKPVSYTAMQYLIEEIDFYDAAAAAAAHTSDNNISADDYWIPIYMTTSESAGTITTNSITLESAGNVSADQAFAIYVYSKTLAKNASTHNLFNQIVIKDKATLDAATGGLSTLTTYVGGTGNSGFLTQAYSSNGNLPGFKIDVIGAAIMNEYDVDGSAGTAATSITQLSASNKTQLLKDLVAVLEPQINVDVKKVGGITVTP